MNIRLTSAIVILTLFFVFVSFKPAGFSDYRVDIQRSSLIWEGHKFFGGKHTGTINLRSGKCIVEGNKLKGGHFTIDMNSIKVTDLSGDTADKLADHLKTADFFDASSFPEATFLIKHVEYSNDRDAAIVGDLTIRGIAQEVVFLATVDIDGNQLKAVVPEIRVDRTIHEAKYGSVRFFQGMGRKIVSDEFTLALEIQAEL